MSDFCDDINRGTINPKHIEVYKDFICSKCGGIKVDIFESNNNICFKCRDCNKKIVFSKDLIKEVKS